MPTSSLPEPLPTQQSFMVLLRTRPLTKQLMALGWTVTMLVWSSMAHMTMTILSLIKAGPYTIAPAPSPTCTEALMAQLFPQALQLTNTVGTQLPLLVLEL